MANRFPKVFVLDTVAAKHNTTAGTKPHQLTDKQVGIFAVDQFGVIGNNIGALPNGAPAIAQIHQNIGDNKYGTVRSQPITLAQVKRYYGQSASAAQTEIWHIGYNGAAGNITANKDEFFTVHLHVYSTKLSKWFNQVPGYNFNFSVYTGAGTGAASPEEIADKIVAKINNSSIPANDFDTTTDLQELVTATKVTDGAGLFGVKIETKAVSPELLNSADPIKYYEAEIVSLDVSVELPSDSSVTAPVEKTQEVKKGKGFPAELAAMEAESQGFDRVREVFENPRYMKLANYVIIAADGKKYDYLFLEFDYTHNTNSTGATNGQITEQYTAIIAGPTGTLQPVADQLNSWLTGKFAAVAL